MDHSRWIPLATVDASAKLTPKPYGRLDVDFSSRELVEGSESSRGEFHLYKSTGKNRPQLFFFEHFCQSLVATWMLT